jgi:hypothetical protein
MNDPTAPATMEDLEAKFQYHKRIYDTLVAETLRTNDLTKIDQVLTATQTMSESLSDMLAQSAKSGTTVQQEELIRRIMEIQRDYNGLLVSTDKLETLRRIHQFMSVQQDAGLRMFGTFFIVASLGILVMIMRTSGPQPRLQ